MRIKALFKFAIIVLLFSIFLPINAQEKTPTGRIIGTVIDADTKSPLIGANILVVGSVTGASTDLTGKFEINHLPVGSYILQFNYVGYETIRKTDIIVRPGRITTVAAELSVSPLEMETVEVKPSYFIGQEEQPNSVIKFNYEEVRRAPGSAGDISRIVMSLPSVAKVNDQSNNLIVRGGSPTENGFYVDNIEIPNINHFPTQGTSGGSLGLINVDFIQDVSFHSGGFGSTYGNRLSSIMDITFREGNKNEFDGQLDLNFSGFGGVIEGPLSDKGSFLLSVRRSYLDLLVDAIDIGTTVAPSYGDIQGKITYDIDMKNKLSLLVVSGDDHNDPDRETAIENDMIYYGKQDIYQNTVGINWRRLWGKTGYSNTSVSYTAEKFEEKLKETNTDLPILNNNTLSSSIKVRNVNHIKFNAIHSAEIGFEFKRIIDDYNSYYFPFTDALGDSVPGMKLGEKLRANRIGAFASYSVKPFKKLTTTFGARADYFSYNEKTTVAPRFSFSYKFDENTTLNGSAGIYYQDIPLLLMAQSEGNKDLSVPSSVHYILGIERLLTENTKFTLELYHKDYKNFPIDPSDASLFLIDEIFYRSGFFYSHANLNSSGEAYSQGIEATVQKKLAQDFYGLVSASYFRTKYKGGDDKWRNRVFDNRVIFSLQGGYKPNDNWEFSVRWIYAGGTPYTPFDLAKSKEKKRGILDGSRINESRYPDYHSLNVRFDRRFFFANSNLVFYLSVWNAYGNKNIATYFWNEKENKKDKIYQWPLLPIFGLEYEF